MDIEKTKTVHVSITLTPKHLAKLTQNNPMNSWVLGEEIARRLKNGNGSIELNLEDVFTKYNV